MAETGGAPMSLLARLVYRTLVWKERERARLMKAGRLPPAAEGQRPAPHLDTGKRGENLAYWYLRQAGYTIVARNLRLAPDAGELDLVGWDGPVLAFIEVKTRTGDAAGPPELAVSENQRRRIRRAARLYLRRMRRQNVTYRFDIASVTWQEERGLGVRLVKDAYKIK